MSNTMYKKTFYKYRAYTYVRVRQYKLLNHIANSYKEYYHPLMPSKIGKTLIPE